MAAGGKLGLLRGLWSREFAYAGPFAVTVDVTRRCNLHCIGCRSHSPHLDGHASSVPAADDFDAGMFAELCGQLQTMGTRSMILCGEGEPLLHPRLLELIRLSKQAGFRTVLITNGTLLSGQMVKGLIDSRLDLVRVSLWGSTAESFEKSTPGTNPNCFRAITSGLARLQSAKLSRTSAVPRTSLHVVLTRTNWREIDSFAEIANETGVNSLSFAPLHTVFGRLAPWAIPRDEEEALVNSLRRLGGRLRTSGLDHNIDETIHRYQVGEAVRQKVPCYVAWTHPRIWVDGTVKPCGPCDWSMGNLRERSFREIWNGDSFRSFRKKVLDPAETALIDERCDCSFCCHVTDCERIHRFYRWLAPIARLRRN